MPYPEQLSLYTIWDDIAYYLESTKDLLSLALTCRTFQDLIIPDHLEYRYIRCDLRNKDFWLFLGDRPRLARGVRFIELINQFQDISNSTSITNEDIALFKKALLHMTLLKQFSWKQTPKSIEGIIKISDAITSTTQCLEALCFQSPSWKFDIRPREIEGLSIWSLKNLTKVIMNKPLTSATGMILYSCPDLEFLLLTQLINPFTLSLMQEASWKRLRCLTLTSHREFYSFPEDEDTSTDAPAVLASFFDRHTNIEYLKLNLDDWMPPKLSSSCLPKLRSIEYNVGISHWGLTHLLSDDAISRLVHWQTWTLNLNDLPQMISLESFCLHTSFESERYALFLSKAPNLKKISVVFDLCSHEQLIRAFLGCSVLTYIEFRDFQLSNERENPSSLERLCRELSPLQSLKYIQVHTKENEKEAIYVKLVRERNGGYLGYQFVTLKEAGGDSAYWGDIFFSLCPENVSRHARK